MLLNGMACVRFGSEHTHTRFLCFSQFFRFLSALHSIRFNLVLYICFNMKTYYYYYHYYWVFNVADYWFHYTVCNAVVKRKQWSKVRRVSVSSRSRFHLTDISTLQLHACNQSPTGCCTINTHYYSDVRTYEHDFAFAYWIEIHSWFYVR